MGPNTNGRFPRTGLACALSAPNNETPVGPDGPPTGMIFLGAAWLGGPSLCSRVKLSGLYFEYIARLFAQGAASA